MGAYISQEDHDDRKDVSLEDSSKTISFWQSIDSAIVARMDGVASFVERQGHLFRKEKANGHALCEQGKSPTWFAWIVIREHRSPDQGVVYTKTYVYAHPQGFSRGHADMRQPNASEGGRPDHQIANRCRALRFFTLREET